MSNAERFTNATGAPVPDNTNILTGWSSWSGSTPGHLADREARTL
jgi:hypothetical protein